ncbi:MAG: endonuclease III [Lachnospiraceae bacterium]|nr:endonuclease III [Lachnospiraceae bacterium]
MKKRTQEILDIMDDQYGTDLRCYLTHDSAWQLLIATILSAQCTDARVNIVTKDLFKKYTSIRAFAEADLYELEQDIKSTGFYHNKAKNIIACCRKLHEEFDDEVPSDIESLTSLPGVGRKTANVVRGNIFGIDSIVVDTHVKRISKKLGLTKEDDPVKIEFDLMKEVPKERWILVNFQFIAFGRDICKATRPECERCRLTKYCSYYKEKIR